VITVWVPETTLDVADGTQTVIMVLRARPARQQRTFTGDWAPSIAGPRNLRWCDWRTHGRAPAGGRITLWGRSIVLTSDTGGGEQRRQA